MACTENFQRPMAVCISPHVRVQPTDNDGFIAYHTLFGNLATVDREMADFLRSAQGSISWNSLTAAVGEGNAASLWNSYFVTSDPESERALIATWLRERDSKLSTGVYLNGLQITSSNACNFACSYCFADASDRRSPIRAAAAEGPQNITTEQARSAIESVRRVSARHGRSRVGVKFLGREPLVNWRTIRELLLSYSSDQVAWSMTTNGSLLTEEVAPVLAERGVNVVVSLDGPPEVHDLARPLKVTSQSTYGLVERALRNLSGVGHPFGVSTVVSHATDFPKMRRFIDRVVELGAREIELTLVMQVRTETAAPWTASPDKFVEDLVGLYEHAAGRGIFAHGDWIDPFNRMLSTHKFRSEGEVVRPGGAGCQATEHQISVEPNGELFPCRAMSLHYGHIDNLDSILTGESYRSVVMRTFYNVPFCRGCQLEGHCQGQCLGSSEEASGDIYTPQHQYCDIYRRATERLLALRSAHAVAFV
jgi:uncharacterized protein